ncbi:hypothetical protein BD779DRAFT_1480606 [Infundibulicybe gibba]|nr:hypothetical protein BD779DRAFT_1480606 [Infundibulicybe gibba]
MPGLLPPPMYPRRVIPASALHHVVRPRGLACSAAVVFWMYDSGEWAGGGRGGGRDLGEVGEASGSRCRSGRSRSACPGIDTEGVGGSDGVAREGVVRWGVKVCDLGVSAGPHVVGAMASATRSSELSRQEETGSGRATADRLGLRLGSGSAWFEVDADADEDELVADRL